MIVLVLNYLNLLLKLVHGRFFQALAEKAEGTEDIIEKLLDDDPKTKGLYTRGFTFDKIQAKHFVPAFMQYLQNDESVQQAVSAMTVALDDPNKVTDEHMSAITTLVKQWDMGAESLRALIEYTHYVNADDKVTTWDFIKLLAHFKKYLAS